MVAHKDYNAPKHQTLEVPNLQVIKAMQSLRSRGYVREQFAWQWYYWYLTDAGIEYLRQFLHLPQEIVPSTLKKQALPTRNVAQGRGDRGERGERPEGGYQRREGEYRKRTTPQQNPEFVVLFFN